MSGYKKIMLYTTMLFVLLLNVFWLYICDRLEENRQRKITIDMLNQEIEYYGELKKSYEQMKKVKHDYDKQINMMAVLLKEKEYGRLEEFFKNVVHENRFSVIEQYTGDTVMDAIINQKKLYAGKKSVNFFVEAEKVHGNVTNPFHICIMLGNALDNAIEGAESYIRNSGEYGFVKLKICNMDKVNGNGIFISISNSSNIKDTEFKTTKNNKDMHGYGIKNIKDSVKQMDGTCTFGNENGEFCFVAKIPVE